MKKNLIPLLLLLLIYSCSQGKKNEINPNGKIHEEIQGEWQEFRIEFLDGSFCYNCMFPPSITLEFKDNEGFFTNVNSPNPKFSDNFYIKDSIIFFGRQYRILKLTQDTLLVRMSSLSGPDDNDTKSYFLRKKKYDKLSLSKKIALATPKQKDYDIIDSVNKNKMWYEIIKSELDTLPVDSKPIFKFGVDSLNQILYNTFDCHGDNVHIFTVTIDENGSLIEYANSFSNDTNFEKEYKKIKELLSQWKPAIYKGKPVKYRMFLEMHRK